MKPSRITIHSIGLVDCPYSFTRHIPRDYTFQDVNSMFNCYIPMDVAIESDNIELACILIENDAIVTSQHLHDCMNNGCDFRMLKLLCENCALILDDLYYFAIHTCYNYKFARILMNYGPYPCYPPYQRVYHNIYCTILFALRKRRHTLFSKFPKDLFVWWLQKYIYKRNETTT